MADEVTYDPQLKRNVHRKTTSGEEVANAVAKERLQDASRLGSLAKKSTRKPPTMAEHGGDLKAYSAAMRRYREEENADPDAQAKKRALSRMKP